MRNFSLLAASSCSWPYKTPRTVVQCFMAHQKYVQGTQKIAPLHTHFVASRGDFWISQRWQNGSMFRAFLHIWRITIRYFSRATRTRAYIMATWPLLTRQYPINSIKTAICKNSRFLGWGGGIQDSKNRTRNLFVFVCVGGHLPPFAKSHIKHWTSITNEIWKMFRAHTSKLQY